jgi:hypothetical protein
MSMTAPHRSHTAWWCGVLFGSNRAASPRLPDRRTMPASPARASVSSVLYTVAKLIEGKLGTEPLEQILRGGVRLVAREERTIAMRCGVSLQPRALRRSRSMARPPARWLPRSVHRSSPIAKLEERF